MKSFAKFAALASLCVAGIGAPANAALLFQQNFDGNLAFGSGLGGVFGTWTNETATTSYGDFAGIYGVNRTSGMLSLSLSGLAAHTTISMDFVLGFLESWDSRNGGCCSPDNLDIYVDGNLVAQLTANNALGSIEDFDGGTILGHYVQANANTYYSDTIVDMSTASFMTFAHTGSTFNLTLQASGGGWQGGDDEAWGIDDILITYDAAAPGAVPEPATWAMMIGGFALAGASLRRRKATIRFA